MHLRHGHSSSRLLAQSRLSRIKEVGDVFTSYLPFLPRNSLSTSPAIIDSCPPLLTMDVT